MFSDEDLGTVMERRGRSLSRSGSRSVSRSRSRKRFALPGPSVLARFGNPAWRGSGPELKVVDTASSTFVCDTTGTVTLLNGVTQGSDFTNRIGRRWTMKTIQMIGWVQPVDSDTVDTLARVMIVYDSQPNGALPAVTDVLTASTSLAFMNLNNRDRFRVIFDSMKEVGGGVSTATQAVRGSPGVQKIVCYKRVNLRVCNDGTTNGIGDIQSGSVFLLTIGAGAAGTAAILAAAFRIRFVDA